MNSNVCVDGLDSSHLPLHVAMIMDGNGRWAKKRLLNRVKGHEKGVETVRTIVEACSQIGIGFLTLYAFSTENWERPAMEVSALMHLLTKFLKGEQQNLFEKNIRLKAVGEIDRLPENVRQVLDDAIALTKDNDGMTLNLALSYGSRAEIVSSVKTIARKVKSGLMDPDEITPDTIADCLYTSGMPDPDLLIRTSGEMRISNFLLWQIAYAEIFFTPTLWPDFTREEFIDILKNYQNRDRRFGRVSPG